MYPTGKNHYGPQDDKEYLCPIFAVDRKLPEYSDELCPAQQQA